MRQRLYIDRIKSFLYSFFFVSFLFCQLIFFSITDAKDVIEVKDVEHLFFIEKSQVIIHMSDKADFTIGKLSNPDRLFFDINAAKLKTPKLRKDIQEGYIKSIRMSQFNSDTVRIVFDINISDYNYKILESKDTRLIFEVYPKSTITQSNDETVHNLLKKVIVLDPGHGGHDPGAIGPTGLYEKDVVLDIARKVKEIILKNYPNYEIVMTRNEDVFIPLNERTAIANRMNADLFVSIHANASPNKYARGIETFILNWTDDEESMRVAARENAISLAQMKKAQSELGLILASLERESKRDESIKLAGYIQNSFLERIPFFDTQYNRGVKQALFYVLVGAKMPSALVEVGFISNPEEERLLLEESYKERVANSIVSGINKYFASVGIGPQKIVRH